MCSPSRFTTARRSRPTAFHVVKVSALSGSAETCAARSRGPAHETAPDKRTTARKFLRVTHCGRKSGARFLFARLSAERAGLCRIRAIDAIGFNPIRRLLAAACHLATPMMLEKNVPLATNGFRIDAASAEVWSIAWPAFSPRVPTLPTWPDHAPPCGP